MEGKAAADGLGEGRRAGDRFPPAGAVLACRVLVAGERIDGAQSLKERLANRERLLGCFLQLASPVAAELIAHSGFDFLIIDQEHSPADMTDAFVMAQATGSAGVPCLLRVASHDPNLIKRGLDTGVDGVMVPWVERREQAEAIVAACRTPPQGIRGVAPGSVRASLYGLRRDAFAADGGRSLVIVCQVETAATVDRLSEIAAVDGVDVLFIGRNDMASSIGKLTAPGDPEVRELIARAERRIKDGGTRLGGIVAPDDDASAMFGRGYDFVIAGSDLTLMRDAALARVRAIRAER